MYWFLTEKKLQAMIVKRVHAVMDNTQYRRATAYDEIRSILDVSLDGALLTDAESPVIRAINTRVEKKKALTKSQRPVKSPARKK